MKLFIKNIKHNFTNFLKDESAQGLTEYILLAVVVVGIASLFKNRIMSLITAQLDNLDGKVSEFK